MGAPVSPKLVGRYAIYGKIASGGMATVHFGRLLGAAGFSRTVAIKRLHPHLAEDPDFLSTMIDEARLAARIHHPNVVPTLDVVATNGELLIVMEYVRGESLSRLLRSETARKRRVPLSIVSAIMIGALHGLHAAHEATSDRGTPLGIVHRDVSPQNILVGIDGVARVIDFGVAKAAGRLQTTSDGAIKGKMAYMAPEQVAAGDKRLAVGDVTRAADIYAIGTLLWEMLAGERLFTGESDAQLIFQVLSGAKLPPSSHAPNIPPRLDALVMTALALDPRRRFATAMEMAEKLLHAVPPAFPTDVSKWVEEVAHDALARRGSELAEIESFSDRMTVPSDPTALAAPISARSRAPSWGGEQVTVAPGIADALTVVSQPSSVSLETPRRSPAYATRPSRMVVAGVVLAGVLVAGGVVALAWTGANGGDVAASPSAFDAGTALDATFATTEAPPSAIVREDVEAAAPPEPPAPSAAAVAPHAPAIASVVGAPGSKPAPPPPKARSKPHAPPKPTTPFKFAQPD